jgi:hypothetical protein
VISNLKVNHEVLVTTKTKDVLSNLLDDSEIEYINLIKKERKDSFYAMIRDIFIRNFKHISLANNFKPDLFVSSSAEFSPFALLFKIPFINIIEDDPVQFPKYANLFYPFVTKIIAPSSCNTGKWKSKTVHYYGNQELAYLHPNYFTPNFENVKNLLRKNKKNVLFRFSKLAAWHDNKAKGITNKLTLKLINNLENNCNIYINSEKKLLPELERYRIKITPRYMHDFLAFCDLLICDSQTMTAEAAVLGTPSIRFNDFVGKLGYLEELEHEYNLTYGIRTNNPNLLLSKAVELANTNHLKEKWKKKSEKFLNDKIDVTGFITWYLEKYPLSTEIYFNNNDIQNNFK